MVGTPILISADNAYDERGIDYAEFWINGILKHTDSSARYNYLWDTSSYLGPVSVKVVVYDNGGCSHTVTKTVYIGLW